LNNKRQHITHLNKPKLYKIKPWILLCANLAFSLMSEAQVISVSGSAAINIKTGTAITTKDFNIDNNTGSITNNGTVKLSGNWTNAGTHTPGTGTVRFESTSDQTITNSVPTGQTFNIVEVKNTGNVTLNSNTNINSKLDIQEGTVRIGANNLYNNGTTIISSVSTLTDNATGGIHVFKGNVTNDGNWSFSGGNGNVEFRGNVTNNGTFTSGTGKYSFTHNALNLTAADSHPISLGGDVVVDTGAVVNASGSITFNGNLATNKFDIISGTFNATASTFEVDIPTNVYGTLKDNATSGSDLFKGKVTIYTTTGTWDLSGSRNVELQNGITHNGSTFNSGTGTYNFTANPQDIAGSSNITLYGNAIIASGITLTNKNTYTLSGNPIGTTFKGNLNGADGTASFINQNIASYEYAAEPMTNGTFNASSATPGNTFRYSGLGDQTMAAGSEGSYHHLIITGSGTKTFNGNVTVVNDLEITNNSKLSFGAGAAYILDVTGNLVASAGKLDMQAGSNNHIIRLRGTNNTCNLLEADDQTEVQYLSTDPYQHVFASPNYRRIRFNGDTKKLMGDIKAGGDLVDLGSLIYYDNNNYVSYLTDPTVTINRTGSGTFIGKLKRAVNATVNYFFPVGTDTSYNPLNITFSSISANDYQVEFKTGDIEGEASLPLRDDYEEVYEQIRKGFWETIATGPNTGNSYNLSLKANGLGIDASSRIIKREGGNIFLDGTHGSIVSPDISRNGMSGLSNIKTCFGVAHGRPYVWKDARDTIVCHTFNPWFKDSVSGEGSLSYLWEVKTPTASNYTPLSDGGVYSGVTTRNLIITGVTLAMDNYRFHLLITDGAGHVKTSKEAILRVNPIPVLTLAQTLDTICNNTNAIINPSSDVTGSHFTWVVTPTGITGASDGTGQAINQVLSNANLAYGDAVYAITPVGPLPTSCVGITKNETVYVEPTVSFSLQHDTLCNNGATAIKPITANTTRGSIKYVWTKTDPTGTTGQGNSSGNGYNLGNTIIQNINNTTDNYQIVSYTVTPWIVDNSGNNACRGIDSISKIYVNPTPKVNVTVPETIYCNNTPVTFSFTTPTIATGPVRLNIEKNSTPITGYIIGNGYQLNDKTDVLSNPTGAAQSITYTFKPVIAGVNSDSCRNGINVSQTVYVNPTPHIFAKTTSDLYCNDTTVLMTLESRNGNVFGEKYYYYELDYDQSKITATGPDKVYTAVPNGQSNDFANKTEALQYVTYKLYPKIKNPRSNSTIAYCENGVDTTFVRRILPTLQSTITPRQYVGGWNEPCYNDAKGEIYIALKGGMRVLSMPNNAATYKWNFNDAPHVTTTDTAIKNLSIGTFNVDVTDIHGCKTTNSVILNQPPVLTASYKILDERKPCDGLPVGKIAGYASGGTPGYLYEWLTGTIFSTNDTAENCGFGTYELIITDANNCKSPTVEVLFTPAQAPLTVDISPSIYGKYNISCPGANDGGFSTTHFIDNGPIRYTYKWKRYDEKGNLLQTFPDASTGDIKNLESGIYEITVVNTIDCKGVGRDTLKAPKPVIMNPQLSSPYNDKYNITCDTATDGKIKLSLSEGHGNYKILWEKDNQLYKNIHKVNKGVDSIFNLDIGQYVATIYDTCIYKTNIADIPFTCTYKDTITLIKPNPLQFTSTKSDYNKYNISCNGSATGSIKASVTGGVGKYSFLWTRPGSNATFPDSNNIDGLKAGDYSVKISYGKGCNKTWPLSLTEPDSINNIATLSNYNDSNISCYGFKDGWIESLVSGGVPGYQYSWNTQGGATQLSTASKLSNATAGNYTLKVTDKNNCEVSWDFTLNQPNPVDASTKAYKLSCHQANDGRAFVTNVKGGILPYSYQWSSRSTDKADSAVDLAKGLYNVVVFDKNNCTDTGYVNIIEPPKLIVDLIADTSYHGRNISCYNAQDARLKAIVEGGTWPYKYHWKGLDVNSTLDTLIDNPVFAKLDIGKYGVTVIDSAKCSNYDEITITQPQLLTLSIDHENVKCNGEFNGNATAIVKGGTRPYAYDWLTAGTDSVANNLGAGKYNVIIKDVNNCPVTFWVDITEPKVLEVSNISTVEPYCPATPDGKITITTIGGTLPHNISWSNGANGNELSSLVQANYTYTILDSNDCAISDTVKLISREQDCMDIPKAFSPNSDGYNDTWNILVGDPKAPVPVSSLYPNATVEIYNRWGNLIYKSDKGYGNEWNGKSKGKDIPMDSYYYSIDLGNGTNKKVGIISIIR
jgi:gliding motility-associated-like protein